MSLLMSLCAVLFPRYVLDGIWDLIGSVSDDFPAYIFLYKDSIRLNTKGEKIFGETISQTIREVFNLAHHST